MEALALRNYLGSSANCYDGVHLVHDSTDSSNIAEIFSCARGTVVLIVKLKTGTHTRSVDGGVWTLGLDGCTAIEPAAMPLAKRFPFRQFRRRLHRARDNNTVVYPSEFQMPGGIQHTRKRLICSTSVAAPSYFPALQLQTCSKDVSETLKKLCGPDDTKCALMPSGIEFASYATYIKLCIDSAECRFKSAGCAWLADVAHVLIGSPPVLQPWSAGLSVQDCLIRTAHAWASAPVELWSTR